MKDSESIDDYSGRLSGLATKFAALGSVIDETRLMVDLKTLKFEEIVGRLKAFEDRVNNVDDEPENNGKLLFNRAKAGKFKGKGKGEFEKSHDDSKGDRNKEGNSWKKRDYSGVQCFRCDEMGHFTSVCPERRGKRAEANLSEAYEPTTNKEVLMKISINDQVILNEENVHPKRYESEWRMVRFSDSSCVNIKGKGSITIICDNDVERIISNVYFIPNLTSNILSLGQATEHGCKVIMKSRSRKPKAQDIDQSRD
ncbi:uncharacterized protein LOC143596800 [Bidens hawaiensis]|uniref:uncharacterized protein LOC143596800 n=1 Tax=Bidens hawaiensis TaxID=980011 RepID=UPI004049737A